MLLKTFSFGDNISDTCWAAWDYAMYTVDTGKQIDTSGFDIDSVHLEFKT